VIDDGSKDHSVALVQHFIDTHPEIPMVLRINSKNKGLAQNYVDGAFIGRGKYYRLICGDNAEPIETIVNVLSLMGKADIIVPYYVSAEGKSQYRQKISKIYTWIINKISGHHIHYYNGLQVHLRHNVMRWHPNTRGFGFQAGLMCLLLNLGFTYKQIPCITIERRGKSGNAVTPKNLRSVIHIMGSIFLRRLAR
jgi:glycosyltransferase involved in cell wall biosynthesis